MFKSLRLDSVSFAARDLALPIFLLVQGKGITVQFEGIIDGFKQFASGRAGRYFNPLCALGRLHPQ